MSQISKIPYQKEFLANKILYIRFEVALFCLLIIYLSWRRLFDLIMFSENDSAVHLINTGTFIDLLCHLKKKDFRFFSSLSQAVR